MNQNVFKIWIFCMLSLSVYSFSFAEPLLSSAQKNALRRAVIEGKFPIQIVEKEIDGLMRSVILIGETHQVNQERFVMGSELIQLFNLIGTEGLNLESQEFQVFSKKLKYYYNNISNYYLLAHLFGVKTDVSRPPSALLTGSHPGPMMLSLNRYTDEMREKINSNPDVPIFGLLKWLFFKEQFDLLQSKSDQSINLNLFQQPQELLDALQYVPSIRSEQLKEVLSFEEVNVLMNQIREFLYGDSGLDLVQLEYYEAVPIEVIKWIEVYESSIRADRQVTALIAVASGSWVFNQLCPHFAAKAICAGATVSAVVDYLYLRRSLNFMLPTAYQMDSLFDVDQEMIFTRDHIMSKNIVNALRTRPKAQVMLVLVGENHLPGVTKILIDEYQFQQIPLDEVLR